LVKRPPSLFALIIYVHKAGLSHVILDVPVIEKLSNIVVNPSRGVMMEFLSRLY